MAKSRRRKKVFECGHRGFGSNCKKCEEKGLLCYPKDKNIYITGTRTRNGLVNISGTPIKEEE